MAATSSTPKAPAPKDDEVPPVSRHADRVSTEAQDREDYLNRMTGSLPAYDAAMDDKK